MLHQVLRVEADFVRFDTKAGRRCSALLDLLPHSGYTAQPHLGVFQS